MKKHFSMQYLNTQRDLFTVLIYSKRVYSSLPKKCLNFSDLDWKFKMAEKWVVWK